MLDTTTNLKVDSATLKKYFEVLVNKIFKILPIVENNEASLESYLDSLFIEVSGCRELITVISDDPMYISMLSTLTWIKNHVNDKDCTFKRIRREVFHTISICKKLEDQTLTEHDGGNVDGNVGRV